MIQKLPSKFQVLRLYKDLLCYGKSIKLSDQSYYYYRVNKEVKLMQQLLCKYLKFKLKSFLSLPASSHIVLLTRLKHNADDSLSKTETSKVVLDVKGPPEPPTTCCMSGCANCVWLEYADQMKQYYVDGHAFAKEAIEREVQDPNLKAFLLCELLFNENNRS